MKPIPMRCPRFQEGLHRCFSVSVDILKAAALCEAICEYQTLL